MNTETWENKHNISILGCEEEIHEMPEEELKTDKINQKPQEANSYIREVHVRYGWKIFHDMRFRREIKQKHYKWKF